MNSRLTIAIIALVAALGLAVVVTRSHEAATVVEAPAESLPKVKREDISGLEITVPGHPTVKLSKTNEQWSLTAPLTTKADGSTIGTILDGLSKLDASGVAATRKENHQLLQVTPDLAIRVKAEAHGKKVLDLYVGAAKTAGTMVRAEGSDVTLTVPGSLRYALDKDLKMYRNRVVTDFDSAEVTQLTIESAKGTFKFERDGENWKQAAGETPIPEFGSSKVQSLASTFTRLRALDFAEPNATPADLGLTPPRAKMTFTKKDGSVVVLSLGAEASNQAYITVSDDPVVYRVVVSMAALMQPDAQAFVLEKSVAEDPALVAARAAAQAAQGNPGGMHGGGGGMHGGGGNSPFGGHGDTGGLPPEFVEDLKKAMEAQKAKEGAGGAQGAH